MALSKKTVIVAEDEPLVRMLAVETLADAGFHVVEVAHAGETLNVLDQCGGKVEALFTDVHMPGGCDGLELARMVHEQWPRIAILVTSGQHRLVEGELPPGGRFVTKPYEPDEIVTHIRALTI